MRQRIPRYRNQDQKRKNRGSEDLYNLELNWARPQAGLIDEHDDEEEDAEDSDGSSNENEWILLIYQVFDGAQIVRLKLPKTKLYLR